MATEYLTASPVLDKLPAPTSSMAPLPAFQPTGPTFQDVMASLNKPYTYSVQPSAGAGGDSLFNRGIQMSTPAGGVDPALQEVLNRIKANTADAASRGASTASALAVRRGLPGSSIEQFGVQTAMGEAEKAGRDAEAQVYLQDAIRRFQLQDLQSKAFFDRSNLEYSGAGDVAKSIFDAEQNRNLATANLTSDEIASQRNIAAMLMQQQLEAMLGQQQIDLGYANIGAQADINKQNARAGLINSITGAVLPGLLFGGGGGGGGMLGSGGGILSSIFGGGTAGSASLVGAGTGQMVPGLGLVGTGVPAAGGMGMIPGLGLMAGAGLLSAGIADWMKPYLTKSLGNTLGGTAGYLLNPIGSMINFGKGVFGGGNVVKNVGNKVGNAIKSVFPF